MKKFYVLNKDEGELEYVITEKTTKKGCPKFVLKTSKSNIWVEDAKNEKKVEIIDYDSTYRIQVDGQELSLDASSLNDLHLLIDHYVTTSKNFAPEYEKVIKD